MTLMITPTDILSAIFLIALMAYLIRAAMKGWL